MIYTNPYDLGTAMASGLALSVQQMAIMLPSVLISVIAAVIVLFIGFFVAGLLGQLAERIMDYCQFEKTFKKYKVEDALGGNQISPILATIVRWYFMLLALELAISILNFGALTDFISSVIFYMPTVFGAALFVIAAAVVGEWVREALLDLHKFYFQATVARAAKWIIVITAVLVGLDTIGFHMAFVYTVIDTLLQGLVYGVALAVGLAFGLGGQKDAQQIIGKARKKFDV